MAEPLKNFFGPDVPASIAESIGAVYAAFDREAFLKAALTGYEDLELTPRARHIAAALATHLPEDRENALEILIASLGPENERRELTGMAPFRYMPHVYFVASHGLGYFETAMRAQYELTKRFTAEFSIRVYLEHHPAQTLGRLHQWARDPNVHVRRLVSEGTRPRLPWAPRLRRFVDDPAPVLELLEMLKDDPEEYVRRSVANNLNDISKDHAARVVTLARRWWAGASADRQRLVRHALRTLVKRGDPHALAVLGYEYGSPAVIRSTACMPETARIGGKVVVEVEMENPSDREVAVLVDLRFHFVKADGRTRPKVFKGAQLTLAPGATATVRKTVSLAQHTTRTHYPGTHRIDVLVNGTTHPAAHFEVVS